MVPRSLLTCLTVNVAVAALTAPGRADVVVSMTSIADAFVDSAQPSGNFGGGGALSVAAPGSPHGEFQSVIRFATSTSLGQFDDAFGPHQWRVQSAVLRLHAAAPVNPIFNPTSAGQFQAWFMADDSWTEGTGTPS